MEAENWYPIFLILLRDPGHIYFLLRLTDYVGTQHKNV